MTQVLRKMSSQQLTICLSMSGQFHFLKMATCYGMPNVGHILNAQWKMWIWLYTLKNSAANKHTCLLAPVQTILPELKISAVVRGSRIRMMTAANRLGLYSAFRACSAIFFRSSLHPKLTVHTIFLNSSITTNTVSQWLTCNAQVLKFKKNIYFDHMVISKV